VVGLQTLVGLKSSDEIVARRKWICRPDCARQCKTTSNTQLQQRFAHRLRKWTDDVLDAVIALVYANAMDGSCVRRWNGSRR